MNTRVNYMYRDASNYKVHNTAVVSGELSEAQIAELNICLQDGEYFIPWQVGLPEERFSKWDDQNDHCWFEMQSIYTTPENATESLSAEHLLSNFRAAKNNWRENERYEELSASMEHYEPEEEEESQVDQKENRGKIVKIDGLMYELRTPSSGQAPNDSNEWDEIISALGHARHNPLHLGEGIYSLCSDSFKEDEKCCIVRGGCSQKDWADTVKVARLCDVGYRPVLIPLNEHTLRPDTDYMSGWKDGTLFEFGTLYMDNEAVKPPDKPNLFCGNTQSYEQDAWLEIRDSDKDPSTHIRWIKAGNLLVADRNLLANISWNDLDKQGLVLGNESSGRKRSVDDLIKDALDWSFKQMDIPQPSKKELNELLNKYKKSMDAKSKKSFCDLGR